MMKRLIALLCVVVLVCSFTANTIVYAEEYVDLDENYYDKESYHNDIRTRYKALWGHLSSVAFTEDYYSFVKLLNETHDDALTEFGTNLAEEKLDKKKYIEILTNIMGLMELNTKDMIDKQVDIDTLKTFKDYALDATEILVEGISVSTAFGTGVTVPMKTIASAMNLTWGAADAVITSIEVYQYLDRSLKNYNQYYDFLEALSHSSDKELRSAAQILSGVVNKAFYCKMDAVISNSEAASKFLGKEVFFDTVLLEGMLSDASILDLSEDEMAAIEVFKKTYDFLGVIEFSLDAGIFISDIIGGFSDCMNRHTEMHALYEVRKALIGQIGVPSDWEAYIDALEPKEIAKKCTLLRQLQLVNLRGEYCFYQMMVNDGDIFSFICTLNGQDLEYAEHFERQKLIFENYMKVVDLVIPPSENYNLNTSDVPQFNQDTFLDIIKHTERTWHFIAPDKCNFETMPVSQIIDEIILAWPYFGSSFYYYYEFEPYIRTDDPQQMFYGYCLEFDVDSVHWILENIFGRQADSTSGEYHYYYNDKLYVRDPLGIGDSYDLNSINIQKCTPLENNKYEIFIKADFSDWFGDTSSQVYTYRFVATMLTISGRDYYRFEEFERIS